MGMIRILEPKITEACAKTRSSTASVTVSRSHILKVKGLPPFQVCTLGPEEDVLTCYLVEPVSPVLALGIIKICDRTDFWRIQVPAVLRIIVFNAGNDPKVFVDEHLKDVERLRHLPWFYQTKMPAYERRRTRARKPEKIIPITQRAANKRGGQRPG